MPTRHSTMDSVESSSGDHVDSCSRENCALSFTNAVDLNASVARENVPSPVNEPRTRLAAAMTHDCRATTVVVTQAQVQAPAARAGRSPTQDGRQTVVGYSVFERSTVVETLPSLCVAVERTGPRLRDETALPDDCVAVTVPAERDASTRDLPRRADGAENGAVATVSARHLRLIQTLPRAIQPQTAVRYGERPPDVLAVSCAYPLWSKVKRLFFVANTYAPLAGRAGNLFNMFLRICDQTLSGRDKRRLDGLTDRSAKSVNYMKELIVQCPDERQILKAINHEADEINSQIFGMLTTLYMHGNSADDGSTGEDSASYYPMWTLRSLNTLEGSTERKFNKFESTYTTSEQKDQKLDRGTWLQRTWKSCSTIRRNNQYHMKSITEKTDKLNEGQRMSVCHMVNDLKNDKNDREVALEKRSYVLDELVKTERDYVRDLSLVVEDYIEVIRDPIAVECDIPIPENLKLIEAQRIIFGNIEQIYEWHKNVFLKEIENCSAQPLKISNIFKKNESKFYMYTTYCQKNQIFDCFMIEYRSFFEEMRKFSCHMYPLRDLLIRPVKRIMTYMLLLREMLKYSVQANLKDQLDDIQQAIDVMTRLTKNIDEMMVVDRLRDFDGSIAAQGKLILHGPLRCAINPKSGHRIKDMFKDLHVFLFEQSMVFAATDDKKKKPNAPSYTYKTRIMVNCMDINEEYDSSDSNVSNNSSNCPFIVESIDPNCSSKISVVCQANNAATRCQWLRNLQQLLQAQRDFQAALQMPIISVQNTKQLLQSSQAITSYWQ